MSEREAILVALSVSGWAVAILFGFLWLHAEKWSEIHFQEYMSEQTTVWIVLNGVDDASVAAVYTAQGLADAHVAELGGWVESSVVLTDLHPDITDPTKIQQRTDDLAAFRRQIEEREREWARREEEALAYRPSARMKLCSCRTFTDETRWITPHGYCRYCGGFTPEVFRAYLGDDALSAAIDRLEYHGREKMRAIVAALPARDADTDEPDWPSHREIL